MRHNFTPDALAKARAVAKPEITELMSERSGRYINAVKFITRQTHERIVWIRNWLRDGMAEGALRFRCSTCGTEVYLVASPEKAFFFRHRVEDGSCPAVTRHKCTETEIRAAKYAGAQEGEPHKRVKRLLMRSLLADATFDEATEERTWRSITRPGRHRRPDVSARLRDLWIAFEVQLSTTFISVVAERRAFYRTDGGLLIWVLANFDPADRRLTEDDILFSNNSNVLVVDAETAAASEAAHRFMVKCHYRVPNVRNLNGGAVWAMRLVGFDELTLDQERQRAFLVDVDREEREHTARLAAETAERDRAEDGALRDEFLAYTGLTMAELPPYEERIVRWAGFMRRFATKGILLPSFSENHLDFFQPIKALMSAKDGVVRGWEYAKVIQIAHKLYERHPGQLLLFGCALQAYGHGNLLKEQDHSGKWQKKRELAYKAWRNGDPRFQPDRRFYDLHRFLFPDAVARLDDFILGAQKSA